MFEKDIFQEDHDAGSVWVKPSTRKPGLEPWHLDVDDYQEKPGDSVLDFAFDVNGEKRNLRIVIPTLENIKSAKRLSR